MPDLTELTRTVDNLVTEAHRIDGRLRTRTYVFVVVIGIGFIVLATVVGAALKVSQDNRAAIDANNQRWCPVVLPLLPQAGDPSPPPGPPGQRSRRIQAAFQDLAAEFHCTVEPTN